MPVGLKAAAAETVQRSKQSDFSEMDVALREGSMRLYNPRPMLGYD